MTKNLTLTLNLLAGLLVSTTTLTAFDQPANWHANGTGRYPDTNPPTQWCAVPGSASKNVIWNRPLPSWSNSSPLIMGDRVFVCGEPTSLICLNLTDGAILWQREHELIDTLTANEKAELAKVREQDGPILKSIDELIKQRGILEKEVVSADRRKEVDEKIKNVRAEIANIEKQNEALLKVSRNYTKRLTPGWYMGGSGLSTPSPVGDGKYVYVLYGNGVSAAYDLDGNRMWMRFVEHTNGRYGQMASPIVVENRVVVHLNKLTALNSTNGKTVWQTETPDMTNLGNGSPVLMRIGDICAVITLRGHVVSVRDGRKIDFGMPPGKSCWNTPVVEKDTVYFNWLLPSWAGRLSLSPNGEIATNVFWKEDFCKGGEPFVASPVFHDGLLYCMQYCGDIFVVDAKTGQLVYRHVMRLSADGHMINPSLVAAGGYIYAGDLGGNIVVIKTGREFSEVARNRTDPFRSTPVFHNNRLYLRTLKGVLCIGEK